MVRQLVRHPLAKAVGVSGSLEAGRALFDTAMSRPGPILVYAEELQGYDGHVQIMERYVGRLTFNGVPTGVAACPAMQHGGPSPATTDAWSPAVGTAAIERLARPVAYQEFPTSALPAELRDRNERDIWPLVDGEPTREDH